MMYKITCIHYRILDEIDDLNTRTYTVTPKEVTRKPLQLPFVFLLMFFFYTTMVLQLFISHETISPWICSESSRPSEGSHSLYLQFRTFHLIPDP